MPYLSQLLGVKIHDSADNVVGKLQDILINPTVGEYAPLQFLLVKMTKPRRQVAIPYDYVGALSTKDVSLKAPFDKIPLAEIATDTYIHLRLQILDQQIVDVAGARVVRVNDLRINPVENRMCVLGIDASMKGLLRRLGVGWLDVFNAMKVHLIDWRQTQPVRGYLRLNVVSKDLKKLHAADLANIVEELSLLQGSRLVESLDLSAAAKVLEEVNPKVRKILIKYLGPERASTILAQMSADEMADLLSIMSHAEAKNFLDKLKNVAAKKVEQLIRYQHDTAGGLMTLDFITVRPDWTIQQAIDEVRRAAPTLRYVLYIYVTEADGGFLGAVSLRWLLITPPEKKMRDLLKRHPVTSTLRLGQKLNEIAVIMTKYNLFTAAVLDDQRRLVGVVAIDDIMRHLVPHA